MTTYRLSLLPYLLGILYKTTTHEGDLSKQKKGNAMKETTRETDKCPTKRSERVYFQYRLPYSWDQEVPGRATSLKRKYDRERQAILRKKRANKSLIPTIIETFGFYGVYQSRCIQFDCNVNVWGPPTYNREYYQEALKVLSLSDAQSLWQLRVLLVVGVSKQNPKSALPLVTYLARANRERQESIRRDMDEDYLQDDGGLPG